MKKLFIMLVMSVMAISANAFEFDGINLNNNVTVISRQISARGYVYDEQYKALAGLCQGKKIYMSLDYENVNTKGKLGQLIVDVPLTDKNAAADVMYMFNVLYHPIDSQNGVTTYQADNDGTTLDVSTTTYGLRLVYRTPYYNK